MALILCQQVIVEEGTKNVTLVNTFSRLKQKVFPTPPLSMLVYATLTDGLGAVPFSLVLSRLDSLENLKRWSITLHLTNPLLEYRLRWRLSAVQFPEPGRYGFALFADGDEIAQRVLQLTEPKE